MYFCMCFILLNRMSPAHGAPYTCPQSRGRAQRAGVRPREPKSGPQSRSQSHRAGVRPIHQITTPGEYTRTLPLQLVLLPLQKSRLLVRSDAERSSSVWRTDDIIYERNTLCTYSYSDALLLTSAAAGLSISFIQ